MTGRKAVSFDIETIADRSVLEFMPEPEVALGNLKDPDKIKAKTDQAKANQIAKLGLNPWTSQICVFGWYAPGHTNANSIVLRDETVTGRRSFMLQVWEVLGSYDFYVTFNGSEFDVPFLYAHSVLTGVRPAADISMRKYRIDNHFDVRAVLTGWGSHQRGTMDFFVRRILGIEGKPEDINGALVQDYWDCGAVDRIAKYCENDAEKTYHLYDRVAEFYAAA